MLLLLGLATHYRESWYLVSEWSLCLINVLKYHWCETSLLSQAVLKHVASVQRFHLPRSLCKGLVLYPEVWHCSISKTFRVMLHYFYKENLNMWITSGWYVGHIWIVQWVSGSNWSTGVTHFQPWCVSTLYFRGIASQAIKSCIQCTLIIHYTVLNSSDTAVLIGYTLWWGHCKTQSKSYISLWSHLDLKMDVNGWILQ